MISRGNVETVERLLEAWEKRDSAGMREVYDEHGEFHSVIGGLEGVEGGAYRGHDGIERHFADVDGTLEDWHTEDRRCLDLGGGKVLLLFRGAGTGKGSGVPIDRSMGIVFTIRDGKVVLAEAYLDPQEALRAGFEHSFNLFGTEDIEGAVSGMAADVEWEHQPGTGAPEEGLYRGREEVGSLLGRLREAWDHFHVDVRDVADGGNEFVVNGIIHARGRISDIELAGECEYVIEFRDSKAVRIRFMTRTTPVSPSREPTDVA